MLGADNLAPTTVKAFERFLGARKVRRTLTPAEIEMLKAELRRFTVRRTKKELNSWVDRNPDAYRDERGRRCRYPKHVSQTYELRESAEDRAVAREIDRLAQGLRGVAYLRQALELPDRLRLEGWGEEVWLRARLRSAARLSAYQVRAALRSSACALVEHIAGTSHALSTYKLALEDKRGEDTKRKFTHLNDGGVTTRLDGWRATRFREHLARSDDVGPNFVFVQGEF
jgi:hypothetical protein